MPSGILNSKVFQEETKVIQQSALTDCVYILLDYCHENFVIIAWYMPIQKEAWDNLHFKICPPCYTKAIDYPFHMYIALQFDAILSFVLVSIEYWGFLEALL